MGHARGVGEIRTVRQFMTGNPVCVEVSGTIENVAEVLLTEDVRHVPIVDDGNLVGMISDRDMRIVAGTILGKPEHRREKLDQPVTAICHTDVVSVSPDATLEAVIEVMLSEKIGAVPVVDEHTKRVIGIVSYIDVLGVILETMRG